MSDDTYYKVLDVSESATQLEIKTAYRNLLKKVHPDKVSTLSPDLQRLAEDTTKNITEAYSVLSNTSKRRQYDQTLAQRRCNSVPHPFTPNVPRGQRVRSQTPRAARSHHRHHHRHHHRNNPYSLRLRRWASTHPILALCIGLCCVWMFIGIVFISVTSNSDSSCLPSQKIEVNGRFVCPQEVEK